MKTYKGNENNFVFSFQNEISPCENTEKRLAMSPDFK